MSELLAFSNVVSGYGDARILHEVDLTIGDGERVAVLGLSMAFENRVNLATSCARRD